MRLLGKKKHKCPEPIVLVPAEPSEKEVLETKILEYKAAQERLNWDLVEYLHNKVDIDRKNPRYII